MKRSTAVMPELDLDSSPDDCMDRSDRAATGDAVSSAASLVGQVLEIAPQAAGGHVIVRWRTVDGQRMERALAVVKGVPVQSGDLVLLQRPANWPEWIVTHVIAPAEASAEVAPVEDARNPRQPDVQPSPEPALEAVIDGKRVQIEGKDEVVLRCGKASITLRRNGRVVIRGAYVESRSSGTNRIKGGAVLIN